METGLALWVIFRQYIFVFKIPNEYPVKAVIFDRDGVIIDANPHPIMEIFSRQTSEYQLPVQAHKCFCCIRTNTRMYP